jgi:peroxiredoxin
MVMNRRSGTGALSTAAKRGVLLLILAVVAGLLFLFLIAKEGPRSNKIIQEGDHAPEFRLSALDGRQVGLSDYRGKVVMVHFWATWCPPCVEELPVLDRMYRGLPGRDIEVLAVSVDEGGAGSVISFLKKNAVSLPVLLDPGASVAHSYGTFKFPETYILDRSGIVRYKVIGQADWSNPGNVKAISDMIDQR